MADTQTLHGLDDVLRKLKALPPEIVSKRGGVVRSALRKGGAVIAKQAKANVRQIVAEPNLGGAQWDSTGALEKSIGVVRMKNPQARGANEGAIVMVRGAILKRYANSARNRGKRRAGETYRVEGPSEYYGRMLETGTERMRAHPWLLPAFMSKRTEALNAIVKALNDGIDKAIRKVSRGV